MQRLTIRKFVRLQGRRQTQPFVRPSISHNFSLRQVGIVRSRLTKRQMGHGPRLALTHHIMLGLRHNFGVLRTHNHRQRNEMVRARMDLNSTERRRNLGNQRIDGHTILQTAGILTGVSHFNTVKVLLQDKRPANFRQRGFLTIRHRTFVTWVSLTGNHM